MTETIYEQTYTKEQEKAEFRVPNNRRQIGHPADAATEVFIEDYAYSYAKQLAEKAYSGCAAGVLVGSSVTTEKGNRIRIEGILEAKMLLSDDLVCFTEESWGEIYKNIREYFPGVQIVGWFLGGPGFLLEDEERQKRIHTDNFGGDKVLLRMDSMEHEVTFHILRSGRLSVLPGHYIYYEKNEAMQNYMMLTARQKMPEQEKTAGYITKQEKQEFFSEQRPAHFSAKYGYWYRLVYMTGGVLSCLAVVAVGALAIQIKEREQLKKILNEQEQAVASFSEVYVVKEGESVESICREKYGSEETANAIRTLNGLQEGENPKTGQKILLP